MQNLSKIRSNSCIHRFILIILPHFVINDHKFYPLYYHLKINLNPSHHSPNVQLSFSFDPLTRDFNPLSTSSNSFFFFLPQLLFDLLFFFYQGEGSLLHNQELFIIIFFFFYIPRSSLFISLIFLTLQTQDIEI